jgi:hypothetical protein
MPDKGVDVEQVMDEVNRAVAAPQTLLADFWREEGHTSPNLAFIYPPHSRTLAVNLDLVSRNWELDGEFELGSRRKGIAKLVVAFKTTVRRLLRWYINPIVYQERKFNMLVTRTLFDISNNLQEMEERLLRLERSLEQGNPTAQARSGADGSAGAAGTKGAAGGKPGRVDAGGGTEEAS